MTPAAILELARRLGVEVMAADGRIGLRGPAEAIKRLRPLVQAAKPELLALLTRQAANDAPAEAKNRPAGALSVAEQGIPLPEPQKPPQGPENAPVAMPPAKLAHAAFLEHAARCQRCTSAGLLTAGMSRCPAGAELWQRYVWAFQREGLPSYPKSPASERPAEPPPRTWSHAPASAQEVEAMAQREARALAVGLTHSEADRLIDALLIRDREGEDRHSCAECRHLRATPAGWVCRAAIRAGLGSDALPRQLVTGLHRCPRFAGAAE